MSTVNLNWVLPTARSDGSPLAASEIASVDVFDMAATEPTVAVGTISGAATGFVVVAPSVGDHGYTAVVTDTGGRKSVPSNVGVVAVVVPPPPPVANPGPITNLTATFAP